jgi:hypothetical protein
MFVRAVIAFVAAFAIAWAVTGDPPFGKLLVAVAICCLLARDRFASRLLPSDPRRDVRALLLLALFLVSITAIALGIGAIRGTV